MDTKSTISLSTACLRARSFANDARGLICSRGTSRWRAVACFGILELIKSRGKLKVIVECTTD